MAEIVISTLPKTWTFDLDGKMKALLCTNYYCGNLILSLDYRNFVLDI